MKQLIEWHKSIINKVKIETGISNYALHWISFFEGALLMWILMRLIIGNQS